ncbi:hypothetical protein F4775DRAFT_61142 [Biscogniauxia sp. FL1348]|nr:hypothetical protein F4775DRAFT_61142 [Biscogniauxia sp. FL1348]
MKILHMRSGHILTKNTSLSASIDRLREIVQRYERENTTCGSGRQQSLPRRLVDLSHLRHNGLDGVQLIDFAGSTDMGGSYRCLSHYWGKEPMPI